MAGIEILSEKIFYRDLFPSWFLALTLLWFAISLVLIIAGAIENKPKIIILGLTVFFISLILGITTSNIKSKEIDYIEYKVTIDNSVSMNEFLNKYEILAQEGKIYTVKEKE